ncbi:hypothetical protein BCV70DRAFT_205756 [Testicularia cyperi]|uniref:DUF4604 domain-containing protein n=1 Tax=Testicularia cyperi TaxID=1882483 RepID=A0A317XTQ2_9BASI|nr:hypothetical protein BCV70DRAFT_205756 [Testicularia cyperi]
MSGRGGNFKSRSLEYTAPETPNFLRALKAQVASSPRYSQASSSAKNGRKDELDSLLSSGSGAQSESQRSDNLDTGLDSDDEWHGAQIVVLKEGKHLTPQQIQEAKLDQNSPSTTSRPASSTNTNAVVEPPSTKQAAQSGALLKKRKAGSIGIDPSTDDSDHQHAKSLLNSSLHLDTDTHSSRNGNKQRKSNPDASLPGTATTTGGSNLEHVKALLRKDRQQQQQAQAKKQDTTLSKRDQKNQAAKKEKKKSGKGLSFSFDDD